MGLDSLAAVDLVRKLERQLGCELPTTLLFEHPSIARLSAHLAGGFRPAASLTRPHHEEAQPFPLTPVQLGLHTSGRLHPRSRRTPTCGRPSPAVSTSNCSPGHWCSWSGVTRC